MPPRRRAPCQICNYVESKYTCSGCLILYCSVPCFKIHKETCQNTAASRSSHANEENSNDVQAITAIEPVEEVLEDPKPLRPLTSLNWPYVPEESAYPDPLQRDDPKPLQLHQYEAIATSQQIRTVLADHPTLRQTLISIDNLRGADREHALQRALGVTHDDIAKQLPGQVQTPSEEVLALRALAEAVESAVRGGKQDALGLDWGDE